MGNTVECCCKLCDSPQILAVNLTLLIVNRALITRRLAEFGFLGDIVKTRKQIAFFCGDLFNFGLVDLVSCLIRGLKAICCNVDIKNNLNCIVRLELTQSVWKTDNLPINLYAKLD